MKIIRNYPFQEYPRAFDLREIGGTGSISAVACDLMLGARESAPHAQHRVRVHRALARPEVHNRAEDLSLPIEQRFLRLRGDRSPLLRRRARVRRLALVHHLRWH